MAKSAKGVGVNSMGLTDAINWAKETYESAKDYLSKPDEGTLVDQLMNRDRDVDKMVQEQSAPAPKPKPEVKTTPQTKNPELQKAHKRKLTTAEAERIRKQIQERKAKGEKAPAVKLEDVNQ